MDLLNFMIDDYIDDSEFAKYTEAIDAYQKHFGFAPKFDVERSNDFETLTASLNNCVKQDNPEPFN